VHEEHPTGTVVVRAQTPEHAERGTDVNRHRAAGHDAQSGGRDLTEAHERHEHAEDRHPDQNGEHQALVVSGEREGRRDGDARRDADPLRDRVARVRHLQHLTRAEQRRDDCDRRKRRRRPLEKH
jgi:hypothetical protein